MPYKNNNQRQSDNPDTYYKIYREQTMNIYEDDDFPLWFRIFNFLMMEVKYEENYISTSVNNKLVSYFNTTAPAVNVAIKRLIDKGWILKYPVGCKRAKGYIINPCRFWFGGEESRNEKVEYYYKSMNKLQVIIDAKDLEEVDVKVKNLSKGAVIV